MKSAQFQRITSIIFSAKVDKILEISKNQVSPNESEQVAMGPKGFQGCPTDSSLKHFFFTDINIKPECSKNQAGPKVGPNGSQGVPMGPIR